MSPLRSSVYPVSGLTGSVRCGEESTSTFYDPIYTDVCPGLKDNDNSQRPRDTRTFLKKKTTKGSPTPGEGEKRVYGNDPVQGSLGDRVPSHVPRYPYSMNPNTKPVSPRSRYYTSSFNLEVKGPFTERKEY